jgi:hypothetical protein
MQVEDMVSMVGCRGGLYNYYIEWMEHVNVRLFHDTDFGVIFMVVHLKVSDFEQSMGSEEKLKLISSNLTDHWRIVKKVQE